MITVTLADRVCRALHDDAMQPGQHLNQLVQKAVLVGWQFRMVFATHAGEWSQVMYSPRKLHTGDPVLPHKDVHFEVRDVYALAEEQQCETTTQN